MALPAILAAVAASPIGRGIASGIVRVAAQVTRAVATPAGRTAVRVVSNPAVQGAAGAAAATAVLTPEFPQFPQSGLTSIQGGVPALPGGVIGGPMPLDASGNPAMIQAPQFEARSKCPRGYVTVNFRQSDGSVAKACVYKPYARAMKWWKPKRKPPISASEWRIYKTAGRVERKLQGIAKSEGFSKKAARRRGPKTGS